MSPSMEVLAKDKIKSLENKLKHVPDEEKSLRVVLNTAPDQKFEVKVNLVIRGKNYFSQDVDFNLETALIDALGLVERQLKKDKVDFISADWKEARDIKRYGAEKEIEAELEENDEIDLELDDDGVEEDGDDNDLV